MDTVNGFRILEYRSTPASAMTRAGRVILVDRDIDYPDRYVTAWQGIGDDGWTMGHYFWKLEDACEDYSTRCARGF